MAETWLVPKPCPRCGCQLRANFRCGCGRCNDDYCVNCGRFVSLEDDEHVELTPPVDVRCSKGAVPHEHSDAEKAERVARWLSEMRVKCPPDTLPGESEFE